MIYALALVGWLLPRPIVLLLIVPALAVLSQRELLDPILSDGAIDVRPSDFLLTVAAFRVATELLIRRTSPLSFTPIGVFAGAMTLSTFGAIYTLGDSAFRPELHALLRMIAEASVVLIIANAVRSRADVRRFLVCWRILGVLFAGSVLVDVILQPLGLALGEVQAGELTTRYLGPVGDSVSFILPLFLFTSFLAGRPAEAAFIGLAMLATGTRGALLTVAIGSAVIVARQRGLDMRRLLGGIAVGLLLIGVFATDFGGLRTRIVDSRILGEGMYQRLTSYSLALDVFLSHPILGVGFTGFTLALPRHEAPTFVTGTYNQWLQVLTDGGLLGFVAFTWLVVSALRTLYRASTVEGSRRVATPLSAGHAWLAGLALGNQTAAWLLPGSFIAYLLWCLLGLGVARLATYRNLRRVAAPETDGPIYAEADRELSVAS